MSDDQIATALGEIKGQLTALNMHVRDYIAAHDARHSEERERADSRHRVIDEKLDTHADEISQAKGRRGMMVAMSGIGGGAIGAAIVKAFKFFGG